MKTMNELISAKSMDFSPAGRQMVRVLMIEYACQALDLAAEKAEWEIDLNGNGESICVNKSSILKLKEELK